MLFPIVFLIMPALFIVLLVPIVIIDHGRAVGGALVRPVPNLTLRREDGRVVAESVIVADSTMRRLRGLLGKGDLPSGHGILLRPAWSIHTAFMRFPIDVVFLDADQVVVKIVPRLSPFKTASCRGAREVIELRAGECDRRGLSLGDRVAWAARANVDEVPVRPGAELAVDASRQRRAREQGPALPQARAVPARRQGIDVVASVPPSGAADAAGGESADVVVIDTGDMLTEGLRLANVTRARRPEATVVLVGERAEERSLSACGSTRSGTRPKGSSRPSRARSHAKLDRLASVCGIAETEDCGRTGEGIVVDAVKRAWR